MAESIVPLLQDQLTVPERASLGNLVLHPGWPILIRIFEEGPIRATENVLKVDPESEGADRRVLERQRKARAIQDYYNLVRRSIQHHVDLGVNQMADIAAEEAERVAESVKAA